MAFSDEQLRAFSNGRIPEEYQIISVDVAVKRVYNIDVRVPVGCDSPDVWKAAKKEASRMLLTDDDLVPDIDVEEDDVTIVNIDWESAFHERE